MFDMLHADSLIKTVYFFSSDTKILFVVIVGDLDQG